MHSVCQQLQFEPIQLFTCFINKMKGKKTIYKKMAFSEKKSILREAYLKMPNSIEKLKRSLSINNCNLSQFIKCIKLPLEGGPEVTTNQRSRTEGVGVEQISQARFRGLKNIARNIDNFTLRDEKDSIFEKRLNIKNIKRRKQVKMKGSFMNFEHQKKHFNIFEQKRVRHVTQYSSASNQAYLSIKVSNSFKNTKANAPLSDNHRVGASYSVQEAPRVNKVFEDDRFWKVRNATQYSTQIKWKTESSFRDDRNLVNMTDYCPRQYKKNLKSIAHQLKLNRVKQSNRIFN